MEAKNEVTSLEVKDLPEGYADDMVLEQYHTYPIIRDEFNIIRWASLKSLLPPPLDMLDIPFSKLIRDSHLKDNEICRRLAERLDGRSLSSYGDVFNMECNRVSDDSFTPPNRVEFLNAVFDFIDAIASIKNIKDIKSQNDIFLPIVDAILRNHLGDVNILDDHPDGLGKHIKITYSGCDEMFAPVAQRFLESLRHYELYMLYHIDNFGFNLTIGNDLILDLLDKYTVDGAIVDIPSNRTVANIIYNNAQVNHSLTLADEMLSKIRPGSICILDSSEIKRCAFNKK